MEETLADVKQQRDQAYFERNQLVAYLAQHHESHIYDYREGSDWFIVCVHLPHGQATWHVNKREYHYFRNLAIDNNNHWDGHTTDQKYRRMLYGEVL